MRSKDVDRAKSTAYKKKQRRVVLEFYADGDIRCRCCREQTYEFLTLDHIDGQSPDVPQDFRAGAGLIRILIREDFPPGYQVLCWNCNCAKGKSKGIYRCKHGMCIFHCERYHEE